MNKPELQKDQANTRIPSGTDLAALLESLRRGGAMLHANTSRLLFDEFGQMHDLSQKRLLAAEIFCKFMQAVEDYGAFCLFCLSGKSDDIHSYFSVYTKHIVGFYGKCIDGLSPSDIRSIYGVPTIEELISLGQVAESHRAKYEAGLEKFVKKAQEDMAKRGCLFSEYDKEEKRYVHSPLLNMYFKTKHGVRVYLPSPATSEAVSLSDDQVGILIEVDKVDGEEGPTNHVEVGTFSFSAVEHMVHNTQTFCENLAALVTVRIEIKNDPLFVFKLLREGNVDAGTVSGIRKPGRNDLCPCGSNEKYKKCHGR